MNRKIIGITCVWLVSGLLAGSVSGAKAAPVAWWKFDEGKGKTAIDSVSQRDPALREPKEDTILRNFWYIPGVSGTGLKFDGFTTHIIRKAADAPRFTDAFTIEAWLCPQAYPWNWCAIVNQEREHKAGYFFGIDDAGHIGLHVVVNGKWRECTTEERIPFMTKWSHIAGTFNKDSGIIVYINGREAARLKVKGRLTFADNVDLEIGRNHKQMLPPPEALVREDVSFPTSYSFDGIIDEVKIYNRTLTADEIKRAYNASKPGACPALKWRKLPQLSADQHRFGAYYTKLKFYKEWDNLWRVGDYPDVVVTFDEGPHKMVFWRGTNYNMNLVTENGKWVGDQSAECGSGTVSCTEHMSDKHCRYAHVRIIENNDARVVVHWRYAPCDVLYTIGSIDPVTGWGLWADEYYYIYPDGVAVRYFIVHGRRRACSITEPATLNQPGEKAEDNVSLDAVTLANMKGETRTYRWDPWPSNGNTAAPFTDALPNANICVVNLKSECKPFYIYEQGTRIIPYGGGLREVRSEYSHFPTWNHWPVSQAPSDGRYPTAPDRVTSSAITSPEPPMRLRRKENAVDGRFIMGLTNKKQIGQLAPLARSWLQPAELKVNTETFSSEGYSRDQRAYILHKESGASAPLEFMLNASEESPVVNPAFVIKNWGDSDATLKIDGKAINRSKGFRFGHHYKLEGTDLIVWVKTSSAKPMPIELAPDGN